MYDVVIANESKRNPKILYNYINNKRKTNVNIGPIKDDGGPWSQVTQKGPRHLMSFPLLFSPKKRGN